MYMYSVEAWVSMYSVAHSAGCASDIPGTGSKPQRMGSCGRSSALKWDNLFIPEGM